jgi:hypothetical protein
MKLIHFRSATLITLVALAASPLLHAQSRPFTNDNGTVIEANLVSHNGDKVKLRRTDGKEFEVNPSIFSNEDEAYIRNWMGKNPATKNYSFRIAATKKKVEGNSRNYGYKRVKNDLWSYIISVTNNSQDTVSGLTITYRVFYSNAAEGSYSASSMDRVPLKMIEGTSKLEAELAFNRVLDITSTPVEIDIVDYDGSGYRYKDELKGCLVRISDKSGNVVFDWVSPETSMKGKTWLNTNPASRDGRNPAVIR